MVPGLSDMSYPDRLKKLKLPTLAYRRTRGDMIQVYKLLNNKYDPSIPELLKRSTTGLRGNTSKLYIEGSNKDIRKYSFTMRVQKIWNSLPNHVIEAKDTKAFERELDLFWSDQELMFDNFKADIKT